MATQSSVTGVPVGLEAALERRYELEAPRVGNRLAGGYANDIREILRAPYDHHVDCRYQLRNLEAFCNLG